MWGIAYVCKRVHLVIRLSDPVISVACNVWCAHQRLRDTISCVCYIVVFIYSDIYTYPVHLSCFPLCTLFHYIRHLVCLVVVLLHIYVYIDASPRTIITNQTKRYMPPLIKQRYSSYWSYRRNQPCRCPVHAPPIYQHDCKGFENQQVLSRHMLNHMVNYEIHPHMQQTHASTKRYVR